MLPETPSAQNPDIFLNRIVLEKTERYRRTHLLHYGNNFQAALNCTKLVFSERYGHFDFNEALCKEINEAVNCFSSINNTECFAWDVLIESENQNPNFPSWTYFLQNINLCGNGSEQDFIRTRCLYKKRFFFAQQCGIMELDNCE